MDDITCRGLDVHKATVCVALAESGRSGPIAPARVHQRQPQFAMDTNSIVAEASPDGHAAIESLRRRCSVAPEL
jgi:hypothetical protein